MNTPEPCYHCCRLYVDCMVTDEMMQMGISAVECWMGLHLGNKECKEFIDSRTFPYEERRKVGFDPTEPWPIKKEA